MIKKWKRLAVLSLACIPLSGCVWLQNEFFVWDAAPPSSGPAHPSAIEASR
ncbi:MAG: hypothetical protein ACO4CT_11185 [Planctomycetota bacterium]